MSWIKEQSPEDKDKQELIKSTGKIPQHIAIIMDGNGRWANQQGKQRLFGHREGIESVRDIVNAASLLGVKHITLYAFSIENWKRPPLEVNGLMKLLEIFLQKELKELNENQVVINTIGKTNSLPKSVQKILRDSYEKTKDNTGMHLNLAISYGSRWDIMRAIQMIALDVRGGKLSPEDITDELFSSYLQTADIPDPDLLIRTSGEYRISNFLLWELAYSEIYFTEKLWPEFRRDELYSALMDYAHRERRFGKISSQINQSTEQSYLKKVIDVIKRK